MVNPQQKLVSVVIPCYKQAHFLGEAIQSVLAQTYAFVEIIVVDDGSPDDTAAVANRYPRVRYVRQQNKGLSGARNTGLRESKGEFLIFLDADDRLLPEAAQIGVAALDARPDCGFVSGHTRYITSGGVLLPHQQPCSDCPEDPDRYADLLRRNFMPVHTIMYRRAVFERVGDFDTSLKSSEDYDLSLRVAREFPIHCHCREVAEYRQHDASMTFDSARMLKSTLRVLRAQRQFVRGNEGRRAAYKTGIRFYEELYGDMLVETMRARVRGRVRWGETARDLFVLLRYSPRAFTKHAGRKLRCTIFGKKTDPAAGRGGVA